MMAVESRARLPVADSKQRVDWFRVIEDICRSGYTHHGIAHDIDVPKSTLYGWRAGSSPGYDDGARLLHLWRTVMGKIDPPMI